jgi:hypothetical protein
MKLRCLWAKKNNKAPIYFADLIQDYKSDLIGDYQEQNKRQYFKLLESLLLKLNLK